MPKHGTVPRVCAHCGAAFFAYAVNIKPGKRNYCSQVCVYAARRTPTAPIEIQPDGTARVPLCDRYGTIGAYALIDAADAAWVGQWAWRLGTDDYVVRGVMVAGESRQVRLHRELMGLVLGDGLEVDHVNQDTLDNRRGNLRVVTRDEQMQNVPSHPRTSSAFRGVHWRKDQGKWAAAVRINGQRQHLGYFTDETDAAEAAREARARLMPFAVD